jgi:hypothetical protein
MRDVVGENAAKSLDDSARLDQRRRVILTHVVSDIATWIPRPSGMYFASS